MPTSTVLPFHTQPPSRFPPGTWPAPQPHPVLQAKTQAFLYNHYNQKFHTSDSTQLNHNPLVGIRIGEASHPGPPQADPAREMERAGVGARPSPIQTSTAAAARAERVRHLCAQMGLGPAAQGQEPSIAAAGDLTPRSGASAADGDSAISCESCSRAPTLETMPRTASFGSDDVFAVASHTPTSSPTQLPDPRRYQSGTYTQQTTEARADTEASSRSDLRRVQVGAVSQAAAAAPGTATSSQPPPPPVEQPPEFPAVPPLPEPPPLRALRPPGSHWALQAARDVWGRAEAIRASPSRAEAILVGHGWSSLNVGLIWAAAAQEQSDPAVDWLCEAAEGVPDPIQMNGRPMTADGAAFAAWSRLRAAMRSWGVNGRQGLAAWMERQGLGYGFSPGKYLDRDTQEYVLKQAQASHPGVEDLQAVYQAVAMHLSQHPERVQPSSLARSQRSGRAGPRATERQPAQVSAQPPAGRQSTVRGQSTAARRQRSQTQQLEQQSQRSCAEEPAARVARSWAQLDEVDLAAEARLRIQTLQDVPGFLKGPLREALSQGLAELRRARAAVPRQRQAEERAWKLFLLTPRMLLWRPPSRGATGERVLKERVQMFNERRWLELLRAATEAGRTAPAPREPKSPEMAKQAMLDQAVALVRKGRLSEARHRLTAAQLAPGSQATLDELTNEEKRPRALQQPFDQATLQYEPPVRLALDRAVFATSLRSARRGAAGGLLGSKSEHYKVMLEGERELEQLGDAAELLARGDVSEHIASALALGRLTALVKPNGKIRGIVTGDTFRRLTARSLEQQFGPQLEEACEPFQFALSTRAGTGSLAHLLRACTDADPRATVIAIDGIGAYDHIRREEMLRKLRSTKAAPVLPFVRLFYGRQSTYLWVDDEGRTHEVLQGEGGEQGDPLMPALYALGQHTALEVARTQLLPGELLVAFLDDVYLVTSPERAKEAFEVVRESLREHAGVEADLGKCRVWNRAGDVPPGVEELGPEVWRGDKPLEKRGVKVLGTPLGAPEFVEALGRERLDEEQKLLDVLPDVPDLQAAWLLLLFCAGPRANHWLRVVPPALAHNYATGHDGLLQGTLASLLHRRRLSNQQKAVAQLPLRLGGLGLRSAGRTTTAAYWASWADALPVLRKKVPSSAENFLAELQKPAGSAQVQCLQDANRARQQLTSAGFEACPAWEALWNGLRPQKPAKAEPGDWPHGWQYYASSALCTNYRENVVLPNMCRADRAMLRSQAGPWSGGVFVALPTGPETTVPAEHLQVLLRRRLRMQLPLQGRCCAAKNCRARFDTKGDHYAACPTTGRLRRRAGPIEVALRRVLREAGARVVPNARLRDLGVRGAPRHDDRNIEAAAYGLPLHFGLPLLVDITMASPLHSNGTPASGAAATDGVAISCAEQRKRRRHPELVGSQVAKLVVVACETGGRWSKESADFVQQLAAAKARSAPAAIQASAACGWHRRWSGMLAVAAQTALAATLLGDDPWRAAGRDGYTPSLDLVTESEPAYSRLPPRSEDDEI
jgi:hypothetical protein